MHVCGGHEPNHFFSRLWLAFPAQLWDSGFRKLRPSRDFPLRAGR